jgi:hypothetical protein
LSAVAPVFQLELAARFSRQERRDIDTAARVMHITSFCGHTADAFGEARVGWCGPRKQRRDGLVLAALY